MSYAYKTVEGLWCEIFGPFTIGEGEDAIQYPPNWPDMVTPQLRTARGVFAIIEPGTADPTRRIVGTALGNPGGKPTREWVYEDYTLEEARALRWSQAKVVRDEHMAGGAPTPFGVADSTEMSLTRANGIAAKALIAIISGGGFEPINWTMYDNSVVVLDRPEQALTLAGAVGTHITKCQSVGTSIRDAINAAADVQSVFGVNIEQGY